MSEQPQDQPIEQSQESSQTLKDEIKNELKEEFSQLRQKRRHRVLYSIGIFALGLVIGFGGGAATHSGHQFAPHGHMQNWHHLHK